MTNKNKKRKNPGESQLLFIRVIKLYLFIYIFYIMSKTYLNYIQLYMIH